MHDQGAGGNGNVLKEIVEPAGAEYDIRKVCAHVIWLRCDESVSQIIRHRSVTYLLA